MIRGIEIEITTTYGGNKYMGSGIQKKRELAVLRFQNLAKGT